MYICIAGKNECAINAVKILLKQRIKKSKILILPNDSDKGINTWQPSFRRFAKRRGIKVISIKKLYNIEKLYFFSLEYEKLIKVNKFKSTNLFNLHFSLLPKYRGCHTNFLQLSKGEKFSGVTLHKIDEGIDTGDIIDKLKFKIKINDTAQENYLRLMKFSTILFKKCFYKILNNNYKLKKQILSNGSYYDRSSVNYKKIREFNIKKFNLKTHNKIRSLIFPFYQMPIVNGVKIKRSIYKGKKINLIASSNNRFKY